MSVRILLAIAATWLIWGSTYLAIAFAVAELPPFIVAGVRNLVAGLLMYGWLRARGAPRPTAADWRRAIIIGLLLLGIGNGAVTWSAQAEPSGVVALVVSLVPLWLMVFGWLGQRGVRPTVIEVAGVALGLTGVLLLVAPWGNQIGAISLVGLVVLLTSTLAWSIGSLYSRHLPPLPQPLLGSGMEMLTGGAALLLVSLLTGEWRAIDLNAVTARGAVSLLYLIAFGSIIGFSAYKWLLMQVRPAIAGTYAFVNPVVAILLGWSFAGEVLSPRLIVAMTMIVSAVAMITLRPYLRRR